MRSPAWPGLEITLSVDGRDLKEYEHRSVATNDENNVVGFVETVPNQNFAFNVRRSVPFEYAGHELTMTMYIDGIGVYKPILGAVFGQNSYHGQRYIDANGHRKLRKFTFGPLETSESEKTSWTADAASKLGTIRFEVFRIRVKGDNTHCREGNFRRLATESAVPVKALKGRSMSISATLAPAEDTSEVWRTREAEYPWGRKPFVTFTFLHRSLNDLKSEGIVPRTPSPVPLENRELGDLSFEEAIQLLRRQREQDERNKQLKTEIKKEMIGKRKRRLSTADDDQDEDDITITEESNRATKRARLANDATDDFIDLETKVKQEPGTTGKRPLSAVIDCEDEEDLEIGEETTRATKRARTAAATTDVIDVDALSDEE